MPSHYLIETQLVYARHKTSRGQAVSDTHHTTAPSLAQGHKGHANPLDARPGSLLRGHNGDDTHHPLAPSLAQGHEENANPSDGRPGLLARSHIASEAHLPCAPRFPRGQIAHATHHPCAPGSILFRAIRRTKPTQVSPCDLAGATRPSKPKLLSHRLCFNGSKRTSRTSLATTRVLPLFQYPAVDPSEMRGVAG